MKGILSYQTGSILLPDFFVSPYKEVERDLLHIILKTPDL